MANCPECGGEVESINKKKVCMSCGLSLSASEFDDAWRKNRRRDEDPEEEKRRRQKEHYEWLMKKGSKKANR
jgi:transcription initiation factor TFIIIB Brf1 subunit/transcription initiation factor TFIIB